MEVISIGNAVQVSDIDLMDDDACAELGRVVAQECVVFVDDSVPEQRLREMQLKWGQPSKSPLHRYVGERRLGGKHWRNLLVNLSRATKAVDGFAHQDGMTRVSFEKDKRGNPTGLFTNGELDWHSDQQATQDSQTVIGLMSLWATEGSQTSFLCTAPAYDALNHDDRTMVDELTTVWEWDGGTMSEDLLPEQLEIVRYNAFPMPHMESPLVDTTATGRKGFRFPNHCFDHFVGMSKADSVAYRDHLWNLIDRPEYVYTRDWKDGQIMFMDQNITLHARPTNVKDGDARTLCRVITYLDKLFPEEEPRDYVIYGGKRHTMDEFADMADAYRRELFYGTSPGDEAYRMVRV